MNTSSIILSILIILLYSLLWTIIIILILKAIENILKEDKKEINENKEIQLSLELNDNKTDLIKINPTIENKNQQKNNKVSTNIKNKKEKQEELTLKIKNISTSKKYNNKENRIYTIDYINENEFHKKERAIKKYNMLAYKKLLFDYYPALKEGKFQGILISKNDKEKIEKYELPLPTDKTFTKIHGNITLHYTVYLEQKIVVLDTLTPKDILTEGCKTELTTYKGVTISKKNAEKDMFKINLLKMIEKQ